jgi:hypothetical protein
MPITLLNLFSEKGLDEIFYQMYRIIEATWEYLPLPLDCNCAV